MLRGSLCLLDTRERPPRLVKSVVYLDSTNLKGASCRGEAVAAGFPHGSEPGRHSLPLSTGNLAGKA